MPSLISFKEHKRAQEVNQRVSCLVSCLVSSAFFVVVVEVFEPSSVWGDGAGPSLWWVRNLQLSAISSQGGCWIRRLPVPLVPKDSAWSGDICYERK